MRRRTAWIIAGAIAAAVVVVLGLPAWLANGTVRPQVETKLSAALGRPVRIQHLSLSMLQGQVKITGLTIPDAPGFGREPLAVVPAAVVHLNWWALLTGSIEASSVRLQQPRLRLVRQGNGRWNVATLRRTAPQPRPVAQQPTKLHIGSFEIRDAAITLTQPGAGETRAVMTATARDVNQKRAFPVQLAAEVDGGEISGSGSIGPLDQNLAAAPLQLEISARRLSAAELARTIAILGYRPTGFTIASGSVQVDAKLNGSLAHLKVTAQARAGRVRVQQVMLGGRELAQFGMTGGTGAIEVTRLDAALGYAGSAFDLSRLRAGTNFGDLTAHGHIAPSGRLRFLLDIHVAAAPHKSGLSGLVGALVRLFQKAKDPELRLEIYGSTHRALVRQLK